MSSSRAMTKVLKNVIKTKASALPPSTCSALGSRASSSVAPLGSSNASSMRHYPLAASNTPTSSTSQESSPPPNRTSRSTVLAYLALPSLLGALAFQHLSPTDDSKRPLSPEYFIPLTINKLIRLDHNNTLIELDLPDSLSPRHYIAAAQRSSGDEDPWRIHSIFVKQPELQVQRPYTPLNISFLNPPPSESSPSTTIQLLIKRYNDGEVSRYLHRLGPGDQIQIRGPVLTTELPKVDRIIFIAGGTGITPAHQIITSFLRHPTPNPPSISILYAAQEPVLASSLEQLKNDANFPVDFKLFSEMTNPSRITEQVLQKELGRAKDEGGNCLVVVCGPESMINDLAGPRARDLSPGPIGGVLGKLGYTSKQVLKV